MTTLSEEKRNAICRHAINLRREIEFKFLELGKFLYDIRENRHYEAAWTGWDEFTMELKMSAPTISKLIRIYEVFSLKYAFSSTKLAEIGWTNLAEILPDVKELPPKAKVSDWIDEAAELSQSDLRRSITERRKGVDMAKCKHKDTYTIKICRDCGERWRI